MPKKKAKAKATAKASKPPVAHDNTDKMIAKFHNGFTKATKDEHEAFAKLPKVHDHTKGEFVHDIDPRKADD
jgi:hypothetical protein